MFSHAHVLHSFHCYDIQFTCNSCTWRSFNSLANFSSQENGMSQDITLHICDSGNQ